MPAGDEVPKIYLRNCNHCMKPLYNEKFTPKTPDAQLYEIFKARVRT